MCFEILGFDILIDDAFKPWLLEVNHSPSFNTDLQIDAEIKERVIGDALELLNMESDKRKNGRARKGTFLSQSHLKKAQLWRDN